MWDYVSVSSRFTLRNPATVWIISSWVSEFWHVCLVVVGVMDRRGVWKKKELKGDGGEGILAGYGVMFWDCNN